jgi:hypothetical protein
MRDASAICDPQSSSDVLLSIPNFQFKAKFKAKPSRKNENLLATSIAFASLGTGE